MRQTDGRLPQEEFEAFMDRVNNKIRSLHKTRDRHIGIAILVNMGIICIRIAYGVILHDEISRIFINILLIFLLLIVVILLEISAFLYQYDYAFSQRGLRWHYPPRGYWIELWKVYRGLEIDRNQEMI